MNRPATPSLEGAAVPVDYTKPAPATGFGSPAQILSVLLWVGVLAATAIAALTFLASASAPQQVAGIGMAVIPYVFARARDGLRRAAG